MSAEAIDVGFADMTTFARILSRLPAVGRPVVDRTELTGGYKVNLRFAPMAAFGSPEAPSVQSSDAPSIFTAVQEQLGLRLEPIRGDVQVLVIDRIERPSPD